MIRLFISSSGGIINRLLISGILDRLLKSLFDSSSISSILNWLLVSLFNSSNSQRLLLIVPNRRVSSFDNSGRSISIIISLSGNLSDSLIHVPHCVIIIIILIDLIFGLLQSVRQFIDFLL